MRPVSYISICFFFLSCAVKAGTIIVDQKTSVSSLTEALSLAVPGDTIRVRAGTYREGNIRIEKPVTILGEHYPVFDGEHKYEIFTIASDNVTVRGLKFIATGVASMSDIAAINVVNARNVIIADNHFDDTFFGIHFLNSSRSTVDNNILRAYSEGQYEIGNGIHMWKCNNMTVQNNDIRGHRDGIYFEFVTDSRIVNNVSQGNKRYGLHFMFSHNNTYRHNAFIDNGAGVAVMYTKNVSMYDNTFERNWGGASYGLLLKDIADSEVKGNHFIENTVAIHVEGVSRTNFEGNDFRANGYAVRLQASSDDNVFLHNNFSGNTFDMATNGSMVLNSLRNNYWDRYEGYDLNKDGIGDVPYRPVNMYAMIVERIPSAVLLWRSFLVMLMDRAEKVIPVVTPENLKDESPLMKPYDHAAIDQ